jgi:hypothetical protein
MATAGMELIIFVLQETDVQSLCLAPAAPIMGTSTGPSGPWVGRR